MWEIIFDDLWMQKRRENEDRSDGIGVAATVVVIDQRSTWRTKCVGGGWSYAGGGERHMRK